MAKASDKGKSGDDGAQNERLVDPSDLAAEDRVAPPTITSIEADDEIGRRLQQLTLRVEAVAGLVETLFDRLEASAASSSGSLTSEELADIAARMVRMIEVRLESQSERLQEIIAALPTQKPRLDNAEGASADVGVLDDHLAMIGRAILDMKKTVASLDQSPSEVQEIAIMAHVDQWFEETNSRQATDMERMRRDLHRFGQALIEMQSALTGRSDDDAPLQPIILDESMLQMLDAKLSESSEGLAHKVELQLASRVQRFEALSQAMMTLVGDPVDSLSQKLSQLVRAQEGMPNVLHSIGELTQIQAQLAAAITSLRQDGVEREALLREALRKLDQLTPSESD